MGLIFKNKFKKPGDKQPDFRGVITINGQELELALWAKKDKNGQTYFSTPEELKPPRAQKPKDDGPPGQPNEWD